MDVKNVEAGINGYMEKLCETLKRLDKKPLSLMVEAVLQAQQDGKKIITMGNGGHANTAAHMINDLAKHTVSSDSKDSVVSEQRFKTMCLNDSVSFLTGIGNDMGYQHVFSEQLKNWCDPGDVVIGISGSGNSANILEAFKTAKARGAKTIALSGKDGGRIKDIADICIIVPSDKMVQIEDVHLAVNHAVADELKKLIQHRTDLAG
ncbi:MAG: SIS domain-containing protein [Spirochaetales bacterium]|nr:MAG: SIS domain-containing protein [Spirochaetales bacterium]